MIVKPSVLLERKDSTTSTPDLRYLWNSFEYTCTEDSGLNSRIIAAGTTDELIWSGTNPNTFILAASDDVSIKLGTTGATATSGSFFMFVFPTTGGPSNIYVSNSGTDDITVRFFVSEIAASS